MLEPAEQKATRTAIEAAAAGAPDAAALAYAAMCDGLHAPADVRPAGAGPGEGEGEGAGVHHPPPLLSVVAVRWGGDASGFNSEQWGATSASVSDTYIDHFTNAVLYAALGPAYEVHRHPCRHATHVAPVTPVIRCTPPATPRLPPVNPRLPPATLRHPPATLRLPPATPLFSPVPLPFHHACRHAPLGCRYLVITPRQVLSIFVERGEDLDRVQPAPLLEGLSGVHKVRVWVRVRVRAAGRAERRAQGALLPPLVRGVRGS